MKIFKLVVSLILAMACVILCQRIVATSLANQQNKQDLAEVRHIRYGLFSMDEWKKKLYVIIADELNSLSLSDSNEAELKKHVEVQLNKLIDKVEEKIKEANKGTVKGKIKQFFIDSVVDMKDIKAGIPEYADEIMAEMTKAKTERTLKRAASKRVKEYFNETFEEQDLSDLKNILERTETRGIPDARDKLTEAVEKNQAQILRLTWLFVTLATTLFFISWFDKKAMPPLQYFLLLLTLGSLLVAGLSTPMIDMEARISALKIVLLDHPITFENQVLYFQTKSILDVFWIMVTHEEFQMKAVGILMVLFSVVFPVFKLISSSLYYYDFRGARDNKWIQFFVLKSGKWSMSDVLVVSIFMAYIGFNGIVSSQLGKLSTEAEEIAFIATNGTSLQPGFYLFLSYTLLAMVLTGFLVSLKPKSAS